MSRRRGNDDGLGAAIVVTCLIGFVAAAWPYLLGTWIAVQLGAGQPSDVRSATGWALEVVYLAGLPFIVWLLTADAARKPLLRSVATAVLAVLTGAVVLGAILLLAG
jgi:hypothetical protein